MHALNAKIDASTTHLLIDLICDCRSFSAKLVDASEEGDSFREHYYNGMIG